MTLATPRMLLDSGSGGNPDTRLRLYELADRICNPEMIRRTDSIEFTDLTTISHRVRTEFPGDSWPEPVTADGKGKAKAGFVFLGFLRRGIPLQHSEVTMYRGGEEYDLPRFGTDDTETLAVLLLDAVWLSCATNELGGIPRPLENSSGKPPENPDDRFQVAPFWQEFLGMRGRSVNSDWDLLKTRFELSESGWANEIWRPPSSQEPKWSYERALLAKLCSKLAFSYIGAAWVPGNAMTAAEGPFEVEFEFQERVLRPEDQVERVRSLRRRSKKAFERSLLAFRERYARVTKGDDEGSPELRSLTPGTLDTDLWRLDNVPETYLGVLDPALDDPDANQRWPVNRQSEPIFAITRGGISTVMHSWVVSVLGVFALLAGVALVTGISGGTVKLLGTAAVLAVVFATLGRNWREACAALKRAGRQLVTLGLVFGFAAVLWRIPWIPNEPLPGTGIPTVPFIPVALWLLVRTSRFLRSHRRETVVLPTWSAGSVSVSHEVSCPPEFIVWQGILARPSNRGRCWKTRPASELGAKAHLRWSEPNDRGRVEAPPEDQPQLMFLELRARLSPTIALVGSLLGLATGIFLAAPALANVFDFPRGTSSFGELGADFVATVLLLLPTIGGAILIQPGEDPIARKLLGWDRLLVAGSTILPSVLAVTFLLMFGWWWDEPADTRDALWKVWLGLAAISFLGCGLLLQAWVQSRGSSVPAPSARQGGIPPWSSPRRRPFDIPAPVRPLKTLKGRLLAERTLLRLAPRRLRRVPRPIYSLILPIEGSRVYTPPAPTVLCLVEDDGGLSESDIDRLVDEVLPTLSGRDGLARGVRNTNVIGWQPDSFLSVPSPSNPRLEDYRKEKSVDIRNSAGSHLAWLRFFLRLQKANTKPSHLKPVGNGGGLVPILVKSLPKSFRKGAGPHTVEDLLNDLGLDSELFGTGEDPWRRDRLVAAACRRAVVDVDGVLLISTETVRSCVEALPTPDSKSEEGSGDAGDPALVAPLPPPTEVKMEERLSRSLARFAASEAHRAGTGSGAHVWPSSFEPPLAGESPAWSGRGSVRSFFSMRQLFFHLGGARFRAGVDPFVSWLQGFFFDNERRQIPVATLAPARFRVRKRSSGPSFSKFLQTVPRVFSAVECLDQNARIQLNLWFTKDPVRRKVDGRALPVFLTSGVPSKSGTPCTGRVVTDVVGDRVWVWSRELGIDHRNFRFRTVHRSDVEMSVPGSDGEVELLTPEWGLGRAPEAGDGNCVGLKSSPAVIGGAPDQYTRSIFGQLSGATEVEAALSSFGERNSSQVRVVARLTGPQGKRFTESIQGDGSGEGSIRIVEDPEQLADLPPGDVVVVETPSAWIGGTVVRPPALQEGEDREIKAVLIGGLVASGKSVLARRLRTQMEMDDREDEEYWEVIRTDPRHNLFFQLYDFDQVETMDEQEGLDFSRDPAGDLNRQLTKLSAETSLLESTDLLDRAYERAGRYRGGIIAEYWPAFSVHVMARALAGRSLAAGDFPELEEHLGAWESKSDAWRDFQNHAESRVYAIRLRVDPADCRRRAVSKGSGRHNERFSEEDLKRIDEALEAGMPLRPPSEMRPDWPLVPNGSYGIVLSGRTLEDLSHEVTRISKQIRQP